MRLPIAASLVLLLVACVDRAKPAVILYDKGDFSGAARAADEGLAKSPADDGLWGMRVRAALALGDANGVATAYRAYMATRDEHDNELDKELLRDLAVATLGQALASPSAKLKLAAIAAVEDSELEALAEAVTERMGDEDDRVAVAAAIAVLHAHPQAPHIAAEALKSEDPEARRIAVDGIGRKVGKLAIADLEKAAGDPDARVRRTAIRWLGALKDGDAVELLTKRLHDPDDNVRAAAAGAIEHIGIGNLAAVGKAALKDPALAVRLAGVDLLRTAHREDELIAVVDDADASVGLAAAIAVKRPELTDKAVARAIASPAWAVRAGAANSLPRALDKPHALAIARRLAADPEVHVRLAAARVLAHGGDRPAAIAVFATALDDLNAAADLAELGDPRGSAALDAAVRDAKHTPEQRAAAAAAHRTARRVTPGLVAALADANPVVRVDAAAAIAALAK